MNKDNTGFYVVIGLAIVGAVGYWAYNKYAKPTIERTKIFGIF